MCTEVVYKAYEPGAGMRGLRWAVPEILGRPVLPPNELARQFDAAITTAGTPGGRPRAGAADAPVGCLEADLTPAALGRPDAPLPLLAGAGRPTGIGDHDLRPRPPTP